MDGSHSKSIVSSPPAKLHALRLAYLLGCVSACGAISRSTYDPTKCTVVGIFEATLAPCPVSMLRELVGEPAFFDDNIEMGRGVRPHGL